MSREAHVRICGGLEVRFLRSTRLYVIPKFRGNSGDSIRNSTLLTFNCVYCPPNSLPRIPLICDFWGAYNKISVLAKQRCFYHLFTELVKVDKHNGTSQWKAFRKKLSRLLKDAIRLSEKREQMEAPKYDHLKTILYNRLE